MRKLPFLWMALLFFPAIAHATTTNHWGNLSLSAGVGGSVNRSSGKARFNYDNLFGGGADMINRGTPVDFYVKDKIDAVSKLNADYFHPLPEKLALGMGFSFFFENYKSIKSGPYAFDNHNNRPDVPRNYAVITKIDPRGAFFLESQTRLSGSKKFADLFDVFLSSHECFSFISEFS